MSSFNPILSSKKFEVQASAGSVDTYISRKPPDGFSIQKLKNYEYIFFSNLSLGTLIKNSKTPVVRGIQTKVIVTNVNKSLSVVTFKTNLRFELILTLIVGLAIAVLQIFNNQSIPVWVPAAFFPGLLVFLFLVYRIQENVLQSKAEQLLIQHNTIPTKNR
jgi:hypothetical protein